MKQQESYGNIGACCLNNSTRYSLTCELIPDILHIPIIPCRTIQRHLSSKEMKRVNAIWMICWYSFQLCPFCPFPVTLCGPCDKPHDLQVIAGLV